MVGLVSDNFHNPLFLEIFDLFTRGLQDHGLRPLLVNLSGAKDPEDSVRMLRQYSVDGVVVASSTLPPGFAKAFRDAGVPVVNSFGRFSATPQVDIVGIDNIECGRMAAREFLARGYRKVAFLGGPKAATSTQDRLKGFLEELSSHPDIVVSHSFATSYSFNAGRTEMLRLLEAPPAEAFFCGDDVLSIGALSAIADKGLRVPDDIGVIGLNDMEMAGWENINLTTIRQPVSEIIKASLELIESMLDGPDHKPESRLFPCKVIERGTLRPRVKD
jgi:DNA-binding LacI/PurR family transcriptional regulator